MLPLATLARTETPEVLLQQVSQQVARIESLEQRQNLTSCAQVLAGLRFDKALIRQLFREDIMRQSVIYQDILQQGLQQGQQQGKQQEALMLILRQLNRRFGAISQPTQDRIRGLPLVQLENLAEALLDFSEIADLGIWLETQEPNSN